MPNTKRSHGAKKSRLLAFVILLACSMMLLGAAQAEKSYPLQKDVQGATIDPKAEEAAKEYLYALARGDRERMGELEPKKLDIFYGPCLFQQIPKLKNARAKGHRALIDFEGASTDPSLPGQGTIVLTLRDSRQFDRWQVRSVVWKSASSLSLNPFDESPTERDRIQEVQVRASAEKYLKAWMEEDWPQMDHLTYDWVNRKKSESGYFYIRSINTSAAMRPDGAVRVNFSAKVSPRVPLLSLIRRSARGFLYVVKDAEGNWTVRRMTVAL